MPRKRKHGAVVNTTERRMANAIDQLAKYDDWKTTILPKLQEMLKTSAKPEDIFEWAQSYAAAEMVSLALTEPDPAKRLMALKDILDRSLGKATERHEHKHRYENLKEEELDSVLISQLEDLEDIQGKH